MSLVSIDTLNEFRTLNPLDTNLYFLKEEGKQGIFYSNPNDAVSIDNIGTIIVASNKRMYRMFDTFIRPEWFGAVGDGITDDRAAIQAAIDSLSNGGTILFSAKNYKINSTLFANSNTNFIGTSLSATIVNSNNTFHSFTCVNKDRVNFNNLSFTLSNSPSNVNVVSHILFQSTKNSSVTNCNFIKSNWCAVYVLGVAGNYSRNIDILNNKIDELAIDGGSGNSPSGINVEGGSVNIKVNGNSIDGLTGAIGIRILCTSNGLEISSVEANGNEIANKQTYGIILYDYNGVGAVKNIKVTDNNISNIDGSPISGNSGAGIYLASVGNVDIINNTLTRTNQTTSGLSLTPASIGLNTTYKVNVLGNRIYDSGYHGISVKNSNNITINASNQIHNPKHIGLEIVNTTKLSLDDNIFEGGSLTEQVISLKSSSKLIIANNQVNSIGTYRLLDMDISSICSDVLFDTNRFTYAGTANVDATVFIGDEIIVLNNTIKNVSSNVNKKTAYIYNVTNSEFKGNKFIGANGITSVNILGTNTNSIFEKDNKITGNLVVSTATLGIKINRFAVTYPVTNGYAQGSEFFNSNPTIGQPYGWVNVGSNIWRALPNL